MASGLSPESEGPPGADWLLVSLVCLRAAGQEAGTIKPLNRGLRGFRRVLALYCQVYHEGF